MKVIDLLNKIANGEEVPKVDFGEHVYKYNKNINLFEDVDNNDRYIDYICISQLNDEVEIIEDKKIEKCKVNFNTTLPNKATENEAFMMTCINWVADKVDEIIDHINNGDDK